MSPAAQRKAARCCSIAALVRILREQDGMPTVRCAMVLIASYNIRKAIAADRRRRPERIIEILGEIGADVVLLQEADRRFGARLRTRAPSESEGGRGVE